MSAAGKARGAGFIRHESFRSDMAAKPHDGGQWVVVGSDGKRRVLTRFWGMKRVREMDALAEDVNRLIEAAESRMEQEPANG